MLRRFTSNTHWSRLASRREIPLAVLLLAFGLPAAASAQNPPTVRQLFEAGRYQEAMDQAAKLQQQGVAGPDVLFLGGESAAKIDQHDRARALFDRLGGSNDADPWRAVGQSAVAVVNGDLNGALERARRATEMAPGLFFSHYQLGLVLARRNDYAGAAAAFERAVQIDGGFAYAHYYAGMANYRLKRVDRMATHFEAFTRLAPAAPERPAVESIMRTLRGR
jgi:tetratricopeptide (TPR) repeat protein